MPRRKEKLNGMYKIHALKTVNTERCGNFGGGNLHFYDNWDEVLGQAERYVQDGDDDMVIFKAVAVVRRERPPVACLPVRDDGKFGDC